MLHGRELVEDLLFADTETTMGVGFSLDILKLDGDVKAARMEVRSSFVVVITLIHRRKLLVSLETVASRAITPVQFTLFQSFAHVGQLLRCLLQSLLHLLVQFLLLNKLVAWLNLGRRRLISQVEEIDVGLHETFAEELDSHVHLVLALLQFETTVLPDGVLANDARDGRFLGLLALSSVLLEHLGLGGCNELILLLSLRLLHDLADARVRVKDWLVFHLSFFLSLVVRL